MTAAIPKVHLNPVVEKAANIIKKGEVLDIGCGTGENAVALAIRGFSVSAIDSSSQAVHNAEQLAKINNLWINALKKDARHFSFKQNYNLIICTGVLHFLSLEDRKKVIENMKEHTNNWEINVISAFSCSSGKATPYNLGENELKEEYSDWEILKYEDRAGEIEMIVRKAIKI